MKWELSIIGGRVSPEKAIDNYPGAKEDWNAWMEKDFSNLEDIPLLALSGDFQNLNFDGFIFKCDVEIQIESNTLPFEGAEFFEELIITKLGRSAHHLNFEGAKFYKVPNFLKNSKYRELTLRNAKFFGGLRLKSLDIKDETKLGG